MNYARIIGGLAVALMLASPAAAQTQSAAGNSGGGGLPVGIDLGAGKQVDEATVEKRREIERAYKDATTKIPAQQAATNDPWANMRGADEAKPAAKPAPKARTAQKKKPAQ